MKKISVIAISLLAVMGCRNGFDFDETEIIEANAQKYFGIVDSKQDWICVQSEAVTITADAKLADIVKVQILSESPYFNKDAKILNEAEVKKGETVTLAYDVPKAATELVAACVSSKGAYYIQVFDVGQSQVSFSAASRVTRGVARRANGSEAPTFTSIKLRAPRQSFNALRALQGAECTIGGKKYTEWANSGWENELMWEPADGQTFDNGWKMDTEKNKGIIYRDLDGFEAGEQANVEKIVNNFLVKMENNVRRNNIKLIRNSAYFTQNNNYFYPDGVNPVTLIPIQANSSEFKWSHIFYYYFRPEDVPAGITETEYIKTLPKFKAIQVERVCSSTQAKNGEFFRTKEFLLPFYKEAPHEGEVQASAIFPKGYKIGFLNMKHENDRYNISNEKYGCTYGDGSLNFEVNHIAGHFLSAMDKKIGGLIEDGMQFTDPRIALFTANEKTYLCFEEGADCTFCDLILELGGGTDEPVYDQFELEGMPYTMCFEDRPNVADYDMNDLVLRCTRKGQTELSLTVVAAGADDDLVLYGTGIEAFDGKEIHEILKATGKGSDNHRFINTKKNGTVQSVVTKTVTVSKDMTIPKYLRNIYVYNATMDREIRFPERTGQSPYAIIIPGDFNYPQEGTRIDVAYQGFGTWAQNINVAADWYEYGSDSKIYTNPSKSN